MAERPLKLDIYREFARIGQALASEARLLLLDLLAQAPRHVDALASLTGMSVANVSQHLQVLRGAGLVESDREGTKKRYRLADERVLQLWISLQSTGETRLAEVERLTREHPLAGSRAGELPREEVGGLVKRGEAVLIDVRPALEFEHGHVPGAVSLPIEELEARIGELPRDRPVVAYCRGTYCLDADEAVAALRERGFDAHRLEGGWPEWQAEGRPVVG